VYKHFQNVTGAILEHVGVLFSLTFSRLLICMGAKEDESATSPPLQLVFASSLSLMRYFKDHKFRSESVIGEMPAPKEDLCSCNSCLE